MFTGKNSRFVCDLKAESAQTLFVLNWVLSDLVRSYSFGAGIFISFSTFWAMGFWKLLELPWLKSLFWNITELSISYVVEPIKTQIDSF